MAYFPRVSHELERQAGQIRKMPGLHEHPQIAVAPVGLQVGSTDFDPARHSWAAIDALSPMETVTGEQQVRVVKPINPALLTIIGDYRTGDNHPVINDSKRRAVEAIVAGLVKSKPVFDKVSVEEFERGANETDADVDEELADEIARPGLKILVGDGGQIARENTPFTRIGDALYVRVKHPLELSVPRNVGYVTLGGNVEVNTNDDEQTDYADELLTGRHENDNNRLRALGLHTVLTTLRPLNGFNDEIIDTQHVDQVIAGGIAQLFE